MLNRLAAATRESGVSSGASASALAMSCSQGPELAGDPVAPTRGPSFSPDGSRVAAGWQDGNGVRVFDVDSGRAGVELRGQRRV